VLLQRALHHQHPERRLQQQQQRLDEAKARLQQALQWRLAQARHRQERLAEHLRLSSPRRRCRS
jgi:exodeoxyribonuclease VII large subunit